MNESISRRSRRTFWTATTLGIATLLLGSIGLADSPSVPRSGGTVEKGTLVLPLVRGPVIPYELTVMATPHGCSRAVELTIKWDEEDNWVKVKLKGKGVLEPYPTHLRTEGVDFFPNPFWPEAEDVVGGRYQLWFVSPAEEIAFYYDDATQDLLGSEIDLPTQPPGSHEVRFPTLKAVPMPFFQPDDDGDVNEEWTFAYDHFVRQDRPEFAHHHASFVPHNLCFAHPFRYDLSTTRGYISPPLPAAEARSFSDFLRNGLVFDLTTEPAEYATDPPYTTTIATYGNVTIFGGGIPNGWTWDIQAGFNNVAPPIRPWGGAGSCTDWVEPSHGPNINYCLPPSP